MSRYLAGFSKCSRCCKLRTFFPLLSTLSSYLSLPYISSREGNDDDDEEEEEEEDEKDEDEVVSFIL